MISYSQSIWQKIRSLFAVGYNKVSTQEMQLANAFKGKLSGMGYAITRIFFFVVKAAVFFVFAWLALWLALFLFISLIIGYFVFKKRIKQFQQNPEQFKASAFNADNKAKSRRHTFDNDGNIID